MARIGPSVARRCDALQVNHEVGIDDGGPRKQSRPTRARGKAGYRRLEAILEAANIVVQRIETENDIGRDAFVDIVDGTDVTGGVICVQVKSGKSLFHEGQWVVPGEAAALTVDAYISPIIPGPFGKPCVPVQAESRLDVDVKPFLDAAKISLRRRSGSPAAALIAEDVETVEVGIVDTFAVGRHDPTAFLLLGALFHRLPKACRRLAVVTLAMTTAHPDVFWTAQNWIPEQVSRIVRERCRWTAADIAALLDEIEETGMDRGTIGQAVFYVLSLDSELQQKLFKAAIDRALPDSTRFWAAAILLYLAGQGSAAGIGDI
jgi:uncharacterized protein DUF4365